MESWLESYCHLVSAQASTGAINGVEVNLLISFFLGNHILYIYIYIYRRQLEWWLQQLKVRPLRFGLNMFTYIDKSAGPKASSQPLPCA